MSSPEGVVVEELLSSKALESWFIVRSIGLMFDRR